jgi:hypothetical protein
MPLEVLAGLVGVIVILGFYFWFVRKPRQQN